MGTSSPVVIEPGAASDILPAIKRQRHSVAKKREVVEETLVPGASVARVARAHGVNANQVFQWRRQYLQGRFGAPSAKVARLLPVRVAELTTDGSRSRELAPAAEASAASGRSATSITGDSAGSTSGVVHLEMRKARLRIEGNVDPAVLRMVLKAVLG